MFDAFDLAGEVAAAEPAAVVETLAAVACTFVASVAAPARAVGAFTVDAWLGDTDAQAQTRTPASRVVGTICFEAWKDGIRLEVSREGDEELST